MYNLWFFYFILYKKQKITGRSPVQINHLNLRSFCREYTLTVSRCFERHQIIQKFSCNACTENFPYYSRRLRGKFPLSLWWAKVERSTLFRLFKMTFCRRRSTEKEKREQFHVLNIIVLRNIRSACSYIDFYMNIILY